MKRVFVILLSFYFLSPLLFYAQEQEINYAHTLTTLLLQNRCIEARELYMQHSDEVIQHAKKIIKNSIVIEWFYKSQIAWYFNKPDTAISYLENLLSNHDYQLQLGTLTGILYAKLLRQYTDKQQFNAAIKLSNEFIDYYKRNPFKLDQELIKNELIFIENLKSSLEDRAQKEPIIKVERINSHKDSVIKLLESNFIRFNAKYNDVQIETWFDTGKDYYFFISKSLADKIGVKVFINNENSAYFVNDVKLQVYEGVIDSVDFQSLKMYNIPVLVYYDKYGMSIIESIFDEDSTKLERIYTDKQISMGMAAIKLIEKIEFDWSQNSISFPDDGEAKIDNSVSNIFFIYNKLFIYSIINGFNFSGNLDTGRNDFINISTSFYENNKSDFEVDSIIKRKPLNISSSSTWGGTVASIQHKYAKNANVFFNSTSIAHDIKEVAITDISTYFESLDGNYGVRFLKRLAPRVIIDLVNMEIELKN